jgi:succinate dehydrogenase (ubiquinone) membrane anchor subunit
LIPLAVAPFAAGSLNPTLDALLCASILIHSHIGFKYVKNALRIEELRLADPLESSSMVTDYLPTWQVPTMRKMAIWLLRLATVVVGVGFYEFETNDVGLTEAIKRIWTA